MMYPSLRGGNVNPGVKEGLYGEVDDVLSAADYLSKRSWVDPNRIYLGGHSTGATLALLAAECSGRFRAVFAFGPVASVSAYGQTDLPFDIGDQKEVRLRAPTDWLRCIRDPVFIFEGAKYPNNMDSIESMMSDCSNPLVQFYPIADANHFSTLAPVTRIVADRILHDGGAAPNISFDDRQFSALFRR
jgi:acetyl esterase/lipase